jgi:hypothetical protein
MDVHGWWIRPWWMNWVMMDAFWCHWTRTTCKFPKKAGSWALDCIMQNTCSRSDSCFKQVMSSRVVCSSSTMPSSTLTIFFSQMLKSIPLPHKIKTRFQRTKFCEGNKELLRIFWFYSFFPKWNLQSKMIIQHQNVELSMVPQYFDLWLIVTNTYLRFQVKVLYNWPTLIYDQS